MFGIIGSKRRREEREYREHCLREASAARLKATILMTLEIITLTASREAVIAEWHKMARPNHPELTDKHILMILEQTIPHTLRCGAHV